MDRARLQPGSDKKEKNSTVFNQNLFVHPASPLEKSSGEFIANQHAFDENETRVGEKGKYFEKCWERNKNKTKNAQNAKTIKGWG